MCTIIARGYEAPIDVHGPAGGILQSVVAGMHRYICVCTVGSGGSAFLFRSLSFLR